MKKLGYEIYEIIDRPAFDKILAEAVKWLNESI